MKQLEFSKQSILGSYTRSTSYAWRDIATNGDIIVAITDDATGVVVSHDYIHWTKIIFNTVNPSTGAITEFTSGIMYRIIWTGRVFIITTNGNVLTSSDGRNWRKRQAVSLFDITCNEDGSLIVATNNTTTLYYSKDDGVTWKTVSHASTLYAASEYSFNIVYDTLHKHFVAITSVGRMLHSKDGISWNVSYKANDPTTISEAAYETQTDANYPKRAAYGNGIVVCLSGCHQSAASYWKAVVSYDGGMTQENVPYTTMTKYVSIPYAYASSGAYPIFTSLIFDGENFIALLYDGRLISSKDGYNWILIENNDAAMTITSGSTNYGRMNYRALIYDNYRKKYVYVGGNGDINIADKTRGYISFSTDIAAAHSSVPVATDGKGTWIKLQQTNATTAWGFTNYYVSKNNGRTWKSYTGVNLPPILTNAGAFQAYSSYNHPLIVIHDGKKFIMITSFCRSYSSSNPQRYSYLVIYTSYDAIHWHYNWSVYEEDADTGTYQNSSDAANKELVVLQWDYNDKYLLITQQYANRVWRIHLDHKESLTDKIKVEVVSGNDGRHTNFGYPPSTFYVTDNIIKSMCKYIKQTNTWITAQTNGKVILTSIDDGETWTSIVPDAGASNTYIQDVEYSEFTHKYYFATTVNKVVLSCNENFGDWKDHTIPASIPVNNYPSATLAITNNPVKTIYYDEQDNYLYVFFNVGVVSSYSTIGVETTTTLTVLKTKDFVDYEPYPSALGNLSYIIIGKRYFYDAIENKEKLYLMGSTTNDFIAKQNIIGKPRKYNSSWNFNREIVGPPGTTDGMENSSTALYFRDVCFTGTRYIATSNIGIFITDAAAMEWKRTSITSATRRIIKMGDRYFVSTNTTTLYFSDDEGLTWTSQSIPLVFGSMAVDNVPGYSQHLVGISNGTSSPIPYILKGVSWIADGSAVGLVPYDIACNGERFVIVGASASIWTKTEQDANWEIKATGGVTAFYRIKWFDSIQHFIAIGGAGTANTKSIVISPDGLSWTALSITALPGILYDIFEIDGSFVVFGSSYATCLICPVDDFTNQSSWVLYKKGDFEFSAAESQDSYIGYGFAKINDKKVFAVSPYGDWGWFESIETAGEPSQAHVVGSPLVGSSVEIVYEDAIPQTYPIREYLLERRINNANDSITAGLEDWRKVDSALADENGDAANVIATKIPEATTLQYRMACIDERGYRGEQITINPENAIEDTLPLISGSNENFGEKTETTYSSITFDYDVQDPIELGEEASQEQLNGWGIAEIREAIDGKIVKVREGPITTNNAVTSLYTFYMEHAEWQKLSNGIHTVQIIAKNNRNRTAVRSKTFTKKVDMIVMYLSDPIPAATMPTTLHPSIMTQYPSGAILKVEATNNAFDNEPIWQDITVEILANQAVNFTNTEVPTSGQYGINIRATLERNNKAGPCWISYLGGYFI